MCRATARSAPRFALVAGAAALGLLLAPTGAADVAVGACVYPVGSEFVLTLEDYPPGNTFVGVYAGPGTSGAYTNRGHFTSDCQSGAPVAL